MNKTELINHLAEKSGLPQTQTEEVLNLLMQTIIDTLKNGDEVSLTGFGTFSAKERSARIGVNPRDPSKKIQIPAVTTPKFKAGKNLKEALKELSSQPAPETTKEPEAERVQS